MVMITLFLDIVSILIVDLVGCKTGFENCYYMVMDSHKFLAVMTAISIFLWFKNTEMKYNKTINTLASATFGILLIHANSNTMRRFLWNDLLKNIKFYDSNYLIIHAFICVTLIYTISFLLESLRIKYIEKPFIKLVNKLFFKLEINKDF